MQFIIKLFTVLIFILSLSFCVTNNPQYKKYQIEKENNSKMEIKAIDDILGIINQERTKRGLKALTAQPQLICAAYNHANDIGTRKVCTHTGKDGSSFVTRAKRCGYNLTSGGEIVACGQRTPKAAVDAWLGSSGHRAIMLDPNQKYFGSGMKNNYWVVVFSKK